MRQKPPYPVTPDGRYFVVRGRLWRTTNPALPEDDRKRLQRDLMAARSALGRARRAGDDDARRAAREAIHEAKVALGERGDPWWTEAGTEDAKDWNRYLAKNTPYAEWWSTIDDRPRDS